MISPIIKEPHKILHSKAVLITEVTAEIQRLVETMIETMHVANGVGLAANQIGSDLNILVASPDGQKGKELVLLNAVILKHRGTTRLPEGCLSVPGVSAEVTRSAEVAVSGLDRQGKLVALQADGLLAKIVQHEVDHLAGHLFLDRLTLWRRRRLLQKYRALSETLRRIPI